MCNDFQTTVSVTRKNRAKELFGLMCFHLHAETSGVTSFIKFIHSFFFFLRESGSYLTHKFINHHLVLSAINLITFLTSII